MLLKLNAKLKGCYIENYYPILRVLSIHKNVINLLNTESKLLISLIKRKKNMTDMSLLVPDLFQDIFLKHIEMGQKFPVFSGGGIKIGNVIIKYGEAAIWPGEQWCKSSSLFNRDEEFKILKENLIIGESYFALLTEKLLTPFQFKAKELLKTRISIHNNKIFGLESLIGLGQGLTPSGDDFITGALLGEAFGNSSMAIEKGMIGKGLGKTTYAGRTMLFQALKGSFPAYLLTYLEETALSQKKNEILAAAFKASEHGSTSGLDTLAGFYWYNRLI